MSENVDLVRSIYADWERGDFSNTAWADPELEMDRPEAFDTGVAKGLGSTEAAWRAWLTMWRDYQADASEFRELDDERVLVLGHMRGRGRLSDATGETQTLNVFHIRGGKVVRLVMFANRARGFAELGLDE